MTARGIRLPPDRGKCAKDSPGWRLQSGRSRKFPPQNESCAFWRRSSFAHATAPAATGPATHHHQPQLPLTMNTKTILKQPSWELSSNRVRGFVTKTGGQLGPVRFDLGGRKISPYSVAPWAEESRHPACLRCCQSCGAIFSALLSAATPRPIAGKRIRPMVKPPTRPESSARWNPAMAATRGSCPKPPPCGPARWTSSFAFATIKP